MSLFDDLLTQTSSSQSSGITGVPPRDDHISPVVPITISELTPLVSVADYIIEPPMSSLGTPVKPIITLGADNSSILISTENAIIAPSKVTEENTQVALAETLIEPEPLLFDSLIANDDPLLNSPLFVIDSPTVVSIPESVEFNKVIPDSSFHDTNQYIDHAINEVSDLIEGIDAEDESTLEAQKEHRQQKEHFAELEIEDEATHQKHLAERAHAEKMKKYLEHEQGANSKKDEKKETEVATV